MGGIELLGDELVVDREPNDLDDLPIRFTSILDDLAFDHVYVSGYVAVSTGRSRATEDIDVLLERLEGGRVAYLADRLRAEETWSPARPPDAMPEMLPDDEPVWVARDGEMVPHLEVKLVRDEFDRASLDTAITARIGDAELPIGPLELQVAYTLSPGTRTDFEDAVHLYVLFEESLVTSELERWVQRLDVEDDYERLRGA